MRGRCDFVSNCIHMYLHPQDVRGTLNLFSSFSNCSRILTAWQRPGESISAGK